MSWFFKKKDNENEVTAESNVNSSEPVAILNKLLSIMDCEATIEQGTDNADNIILNISTDEAARIIGEKGETLYSLQYLVNRILYAKSPDNRKVLIDIDNYRSKRNEKLVEMAQKAAETTKKSGKAFSLPPLNSYERKIVHESLQDDNEVDTQSEGEGYYKKVFVSLRK